MANIDKRPLKAYVRFDGTGRIVPSSLILRRKMPKVGKWAEIPAYECCATQTSYDLFYTPELPITWPVVVFSCNGEGVPVASGFPGTYTTLEDLVTDLNTEVGPLFGVFSVFNGGVKLTVTAEFKNTNCPTGILTFAIIPD